MPDAIDDGALAECAGGNAAGMETLYRRHSAACLSLARSILVDAHLSEDAVQEAFLQLWRDADQFDTRRSSVRARLMLLTRCKAIDRVRSEERRKTSVLTAGADQPDGRPSPDVQVVLTLVGEHAREALAQLPAPKREAVVLAFWGGYSQPEIAALTNAPLGTVKSRMHDGLRTLGCVLAQRGYVAGTELDA